MIGILAYNLLPYENLKTANYYYFPKEKVLVILDKKDRKIKKLEDRAKIIVGEKEKALKSGSEISGARLIINKNLQIK